MYKCTIKTLPSLNLAIPSAPISVFSHKLKQLSLEMYNLMQKKKGIGIAAPQCDYNLRVVVLHKTYFDGNICTNFDVDGKFLCIVNPKIRLIKENKISVDEGCLSLPNAVHHKIPRCEVILLDAQNLEGSSFSIELSGTPAIIVQHEVDHLDGILYPFRLDSTEYMQILNKYRQYNLIENSKIKTFLEMVNFNMTNPLSENYDYDELKGYCLSKKVDEKFVEDLWKRIIFINES